MGWRYIGDIVLWWHELSDNKFTFMFGYMSPFSDCLLISHRFNPMADQV